MPREDPISLAVEPGRSLGPFALGTPVSSVLPLLLSNDPRTPFSVSHARAKKHSAHSDPGREKRSARSDPGPDLCVFVGRWGLVLRFDPVSQGLVSAEMAPVGDLPAPTPGVCNTPRSLFRGSDSTASNSNSNANSANIGGSHANIGGSHANIGGSHANANGGGGHANGGGHAGKGSSGGGAQSNGAQSNGAQSNGAQSNGAQSNGAQKNGGGIGGGRGVAGAGAGPVGLAWGATATVGGIPVAGFSAPSPPAGKGRSAAARGLFRGLAGGAFASFEGPGGSCDRVVVSLPRGRIAQRMAHAKISMGGGTGVAVEIATAIVPVASFASVSSSSRAASAAAPMASPAPPVPSSSAPSSSSSSSSSSAPSSASSISGAISNAMSSAISPGGVNGGDSMGAARGGGGGRTVRAVVDAHSSAQDLISDLGTPGSLFPRLDPHGHDRSATKDTYYSYPALGCDILVDGELHTAKRVVLHGNWPDDPRFGSHERCHWSLDRGDFGIEASGLDSWDEIASRLGDRGYEGPIEKEAVVGAVSTTRVGALKCYMARGIVFEVLPSGRIASVTVPLATTI